LDGDVLLLVELKLSVAYEAKLVNPLVRIGLSRHGEFVGPHQLVAGMNLLVAPGGKGDQNR
jgi:hypothetical protein